MKSDFKRIIEKWIPQNTKVLDLGCGDGDLLEHLKDSKILMVLVLKLIYLKLMNVLEEISQLCNVILTRALKISMIWTLI